MVWATDSYGGSPAGVVHSSAGDSFGRPVGPACGLSFAGMFLFADVDLDEVPPEWRCPGCEGQRRRP